MEVRLARCVSGAGAAEWRAAAITSRRSGGADALGGSCLHLVQDLLHGLTSYRFTCCQ